MGVHGQIRHAATNGRNFTNHEFPLLFIFNVGLSMSPLNFPSYPTTGRPQGYAEHLRVGGGKGRGCGCYV